MTSGSDATNGVQVVLLHPATGRGARLTRARRIRRLEGAWEAFRPASVTQEGLLGCATPPRHVSQVCRWAWGLSDVDHQ